MKNTKGKVEIIEQLCESKSGVPEENEDLIVVNDSFVAVFDGATNKYAAKFDGKTGGQIAAGMLADCLNSPEFPEVIRDMEPIDAVNCMQTVLREHSRWNHLEDNDVHVCAAGVIYNIERHQIWVICDCQFMLNGVAYTFTKEVDDIIADARALSIQMLINSGKTESELLAQDDSRDMIIKMLRMQKHLENRDTPYGYSVFSGLGRIHRLPVFNIEPGSEIALASDGYPVLCSTLEATEKKLLEIMEKDPLCRKENRATKGLRDGNRYFDDRSYIRFRVLE